MLLHVTTILFKRFLVVQIPNQLRRLKVRSWEWVAASRSGLGQIKESPSGTF